MNELIKINPDGRTTSRELYEFLQLDLGQYSRWCKTNLLENEFSEEGTDWGLLDTNDEYSGRGQRATNYWLSISFAKKLCMMSKSERGNQARDYFIEIERRYAEQPKLTQIQMLAAMAQQMADQEQMMLAASANASTALRQIDFIRETIVRRDDDNWRANINLDLNAIVKASGKTYQDVRSESYDLLDSRGGCRLSVRVANARERLREAGAKKTVIEKFCKLDAVEEDSKLREIYSNIVKEMAIRDIGGATCRI